MLITAVSNRPDRRLVAPFFALAMALLFTACSDAEQNTEAVATPVASAPEPATNPVPPAIAEPVAEETVEAEPELIHGFELTDLEGNTRNAEEWNGKPLLVNFWATWCIPCRKEMPALMELHEKYSDQGFEVIGIAADESEKILAFLEETHVSYPILYGEMTSVFDISESYGNFIGVLPHTAFVDRDGVIRHVKVGEISHEEAEEMILDIL